MLFKKQGDPEFAKGGESYSHAGFLIAALGLLFSSEILWAEGNNFPVESVFIGVLCIIAGAVLVLFGRRRSVGADTDANAENDT